ARLFRADSAARSLVHSRLHSCVAIEPERHDGGRAQRAARAVSGACFPRARHRSHAAPGEAGHSGRSGVKMSTAHMTNLDLSAPPVIRLIGRRSLIVGAIASVIAVALAFTNPTVFFRGYLLSYMDWLTVCLGAMAILMIRHLTGGGW